MQSAASYQATMVIMRSRKIGCILADSPGVVNGDAPAARRSNALLRASQYAWFCTKSTSATLVSHVLPVSNVTSGEIAAPVGPSTVSV